MANPDNTGVLSRWNFAAPLSPVQLQAQALLCRELNLTAASGRLLVRRGFETPAQADVFFQRRFDQLHDPALLPDIGAAVQRIAAAVEKSQRIVLFGDYDVDGITATALLHRFFNVLKKRTRSSFVVESLVPDRKDGYGLTPAAVEMVRRKKPDLLITLDNGISAHTALDAFHEAGIDCIVVDHHHLHGELPRALAVINPKRPDSTYPFNELCGAGISFKLAWALAVHYSQDKRVTPDFKTFLLDAVALAGMGTLADVVPLVGENRVLAHQGLVALNKSQMPGLRALLETAALRGPAKAFDVGFRIGPRLNAAGRCGEVSEALELLLTEDSGRAMELAQQLNDYNAERQAIQKQIADQAREQVLRTLSEAPHSRAFVLASDEWHHGIVGIVASRIVDEFRRPALVLSIDREKQVARGSGRSVRGFHLAEALNAHGSMLLTHGGHAAAAGLSLHSGNLAAFREAFHATAQTLLKDHDPSPYIGIDESVPLAEVSQKFCVELEKFEPFGMGNPRPVFAVSGASISSPPRLMGKGEEHVNFYVRDGKVSLRVIGWNMATHLSALTDLNRGGLIDIAFRPQTSSFRGETSVELVMEAFRAGSVIRK
ncbi:MAG TPA: single-stranded-DNA-specific exonuclease RecJ [Planctomycetota bacterium]|nr:single-stranded-DNA-specific exonuclease RecJ [Planctomycetota bacterium]